MDPTLPTPDDDGRNEAEDHLDRLLAERNYEISERIATAVRMLNRVADDPDAPFAKLGLESAAAIIESVRQIQAGER